MKKRKNWFLLGIYVLVVIINVLFKKFSQSILLYENFHLEAFPKLRPK